MADLQAKLLHIYCFILPGFVTALMLILPVLPASGIGLEVTGSDWGETVDPSNIASGLAGNDFAAPPDSPEVSIRIWDTSGNRTWYVYVQKTDGTLQAWNPGLTLHAIRTGNGSGTGTDPTGGEEPGVVVPTATTPVVPTQGQLFFQGKRERTGITVMLRITGLTASLGAGISSSTVYYTVTH